MEVWAEVMMFGKTFVGNGGVAVWERVRRPPAGLAPSFRIIKLAFWFEMAAV